MAGRRSAHAGQAASCRDPRVRAARGRVRVHGLVLVGAALGQALEAGASSAVGRFRRIEVGAGKRAGRFRPGPGRGRGRGTGRAFPGGVVPVLGHALGGGIAGRDRGMRVPGSAGGVREDGHGARGRLFSLFCAHYGFEPRFRDPYSGHEKGSMENAVGFRGARPDGADAVGRELPGVDPRVAGRVRTRLRVGPLPAWRSGAGTVRSGEGPHAALARRRVRPV